MLKKLIRSGQTLFPGVQDLRFRAESRLLHAIDRPYRPEYRAVRYLVARDPLFIDIGAHRGLSVSALRTMRPDARIVAFEPNHHLASRLRQNHANDPNVRVESCGLGARSDMLTLHIPVYRGYRFDGLASLDRRNAEEWLNPDRVYWFDRSKLVIEAMQVRIRRLDEFQLTPFLIKMYVQGYEKQVIAGATATIEQHHPVILAPSHNDEVYASLTRFGYKRFTWSEGRFRANANFGFIVFYLHARHIQDLDLAASNRLLIA